jgi:protease-4
MLDEIHPSTSGEAGRGVRLKDAPGLFSGLIWNGARSVDMGLADALGSVDDVARDVIKAEELVDYTVKEKLTDRLARRFGGLLGNGFTAVIGQAKMR